MVVDSSAIIAIILEEPGFEQIGLKINLARRILIGAPTVFEAAMVLENRQVDRGSARLMKMIVDEEIDIVDFGANHQAVALEAFLRFGKGRHPAKLNFGDCMSYATARIAREPLLYAGDDFAKTDIDAA